MIGIIVESFGDYVKTRCAPAAGERLGQMLAGVKVLATADYPDETVMGAIGGVADALGVPTASVVEGFGEHFIAWARPRYRMAFAAPSARDFLLGMEAVHRSAKVVAKSARPPEFGFEAPGPDRLVMIYRSPRRLCTLMRGLYRGVAAAFGEKIEVAETRCMHQGHPECRFELQFGK